MSLRPVIRGVAVVLSLLLGVWAAASPAFVTPIETAYSPDLTADQTIVSGGLEMLFLGWIELPAAWLANICLAVCLWRLSRPRPMTLRGAFICLVMIGAGLALALSGLKPTHFGGLMDDHGVNGLSHPLVGARVWVLAFIPPLIPVIIDFPICLAATIKKANEDWPASPY